MYTERIAVIDIGSNTIRLVIFGINEYFDIDELHNIKTPARLAECFEIEKGQQIINETGYKRIKDALVGFKEVMDHFEVTTIKAMATEAMRQAHNQEDIIQRLKEETNIEIQVISGLQEAAYGQYAVTHTTTLDDSITIDMGGASTEITRFIDREMADSISLPFGTVSLKEQFFEGKDHNDPKAMADVRAFLNEQFKQIDWLRKAKLPITAMGGSARNIANVHQRMINYPIAGIHGYVISPDGLKDTLALFIHTEYKKMSEIDGLSNDRIDIIIPATIAFMELCDIVKTDAVYISTQGLREGIIIHHINQTYNIPIDNQQIKVRTISQIGRKLPVNLLGSFLRINFCINLYQQMCQLGIQTYDYAQHTELEFAAYLYRMGSFISEESDSEHTFYLLSNMNLFGFTHKRRLRLALIASFRNKSLFKQHLTDFEGWFTDEEINQIYDMCCLLKFSVALNNSRTNPISHLKLNRLDANHFELNVYHDRPVIAEVYRTSRHKKHLERALKGNLTINFIDTSLN